MTRNYQARAERHCDNKLKGKEGEHMKREDIAKIFEGATDEQISKVLDINSADIGRAKGSATKLQEDLDAANAALTKANDTIKALEASKGDLDKVQKELEDYKAAEQKRIADEKAAAERRGLLDRMDAVMGGRKFVHDRMRDIVADEFGKAILDKANTGKADKDIFDAVTKDQGYFASQNPPAGNMGGAGHISDEAAHLAAMRAAMGLPAETK
jgi:Skp family chaperone for outer membrane proteins